MKTEMSDEEYWERAALAVLTGMCTDPFRSVTDAPEVLDTPKATAYLCTKFADAMVAERSARHKKQHGMQEE